MYRTTCRSSDAPVCRISDGLAAGRMASIDELIGAAVDGGSKRVRPLLMTVLTNVFGLLPILLDEGTGADVAKRTSRTHQ